MVLFEDGNVRRLSDGRPRDGVGAFAGLEMRASDREWMLAQAAGVRRKQRRADGAAWTSAVLAYFARR